jgi:NAD(P)H-flavin reductase
MSKIPAHLESRIELSEGLAIFRFAMDHDFFFHAGQYATLWLTHGGKTLARPYSIASSPSKRRVLEFYINLVKEGELTPSLWQGEVIDGLSRRDPDTTAAVTGPKGRFILDPEDTRDLVFIASGTGLAPFVSMIRKLNEDYLASPRNFRARRVSIIHGVSYPSHLGYRKELEELASETMKDARRKLAILYFPTISRPFMDFTWAGLKGRAETLLDIPSRYEPGHPNLEDSVRGVLKSILRPETHAVYVCGYPGTVDNVVRTLSHRGFRVDSDIKREKYYP